MTTGPHICGACGKRAATVERDAQEVHASCANCGKTKTELVIWCSVDDRTTAMLIHRPAVKRGPPRKRSGGDIASATGGIRL